MTALFLAVMLRLVLQRGEGSCVSYAVERDTGSGWQAATSYAGPSATLLKAPGAGPADTFWVSQSTARLATGVYRCACVAARGDTGAWSPLAVVAPAGAWPDTLAAVWQAGRLSWLRTPGGLTLYGDTARVVVEHQELVQRRERARILELFGFWVLRGEPRYTDSVE